jgi:hypothetical protein
VHVPALQARDRAKERATMNSPAAVVCLTQVLCGLGVLLALAWLYQHRWW